MINTIKSLVGEFTMTELQNAIPKAANKLANILTREGSANGKRFENKYIANLIADEIKQERISCFTIKRNNEFLQKEKAQRQSVAPIQINITIIA